MGRVPLPSPVERMDVNPFTGKPVRGSATRDPQPGVDAEVPETLAFEHITLPDRDDWISDYVILDLLLAGKEDVAIPEWDRDAEFVSVMKARGLFEMPLYGLRRCLLLSVPSRIRIALSALTEVQLEGLLIKWNAHSSSPNTLEELTQLWSLACHAADQHREMFLWLDTQPREPCGE